MLGLAVGDAISWPALFQRGHLLPDWTRRLRREIEDEAEIHKIIRPSVPFSLNRSQSSFKIGPADDTEWASFSAQLIISCQKQPDKNIILDNWRQLVKNEDNIKGSISIRSAIKNLKSGKVPPITGKDNPHYFDDSGCPRAIPYGVLLAGKPIKAALACQKEVEVTNSFDGLEAAKALAAIISVLVDDGTIDEAISVGLKEIDELSWLHRNTIKALEIASNVDVFSLVPILADDLIENIYSYGTSAPETLPIALALFKAGSENFSETLFASASLARTADSVPAMVGALLGAYLGDNEIPNIWYNKVEKLKGIAIPNLKNINYIKLINNLASLGEDNYTTFQNGGESSEGNLC